MICPQCNVKIDGKAVIFSHGKQGDKERLYSRVCRHVKGREGNQCINDCTTYSQDKDYGFMPTHLDHDAMAEELLKTLPISQKL